MEKRKAMSKARILKSKLEPKKTPEEVHSHSASRLTKLTDLKKNVSPLGQRILKNKGILNKRSAETPKPKLEDTDQKSFLSQGPSDSHYMSHINSLMEKITEQKIKRQQLEDKLKSQEHEFRLQEAGMKKELESLSIENKKIRKEKTLQEGKIMEDNFLIRKEFEECKVQVNLKAYEILNFLRNPPGKDPRETVEELLAKVADILNVENSVVRSLELKDTASFSYLEPEVVTPPAAVSNGFLEAIALHSHVADSPEEISLSPGDRVMVFNNDEGNGWWIGKVGDEIGRFPKTCVMLD
jgi:hypothetical protein